MKILWKYLKLYKWLIILALVVARFGMDIFIEGLKQSLRLSYQEFEQSRSGETYLLSGVITESLRNIELIKCQGLTCQEIRRLNKMTRDIFDLEIKKAKKVISQGFAQGVALNLLKNSILFILLWLIFRHVLTTGELIAMQFISTTIFMPLQIGERSKINLEDFIHA
jgi:ATP-binding cassette, subfamily B, bacterial